MTMTKDSFGQIDGEEVFSYTLKNNNGIEMVFTNYGGTILSVKSPDQNGRIEEVTLCYQSLDKLSSTTNRPYFGCTVGRFANRIGKATFDLNGKTYTIAANNGPNHLHGGLKGFDQKIWSVKEIEQSNAVGLEFSYFSVDGEENYPGNLQVKVKYLLTNGNDLVIEYYAESDAPTIVNLTNHTYWNLSGNYAQDVGSHDLQLACDHFLPLTADQIPTGQIAPVQTFPLFDFSTKKRLGDVLTRVDETSAHSGLDHCFVVNGALRADGQYEYDVQGQLQQQQSYLRLVGTLTHPGSGRTLTVHTTQPGVQIYSGNFLSLEKEQDFPFIQHNAICLETQHFPDSLHHPHFPTVVISGNGAAHPYYHKSIFSFGIL